MVVEIHTNEQGVESKTVHPVTPRPDQQSILRLDRPRRVMPQRAARTQAQQRIKKKVQAGGGSEEEDSDDEPLYQPASPTSE